MSDTIAAVATPLAMGSVAVIRISGPKSYEIIKKIFTPIHSEKDPLTQRGYTALYGHIEDGGEELDEVVTTYFRAPLSFTGEDVVEISCHGGVFITREILKLVLRSGARLAQPGEFSKRAVLNGKMTITQAEGIMDLITARTKQASKAGLAARNGALYHEVSRLKEGLVAIAAHLGAFIDYPEEEIDQVESDDLASKLTRLQSRIQHLLDTYDKGTFIREGIATAIVGKPNAGKSTLMNQLAGTQKSIVTDIPGTTRDIVEDTVQIGDVLLRLADTAGIRTTSDTVEHMGVEMAKEKSKEADLILAVFDGSVPLSQEDDTIFSLIKDTPSIAIVNKSDLPQKIELEKIKAHFTHIVEISAVNNEGIQKLSHMVEEIFHLSGLDPSAAILANERQRQCAIHCYENVTEALTMLQAGMTLDALSLNIDDAITALLELTGEFVTEVVVDKLFENFCVGK